MFAIAAIIRRKRGTYCHHVNSMTLNLCTMLSIFWHVSYYCMVLCTWVYILTYALNMHCKQFIHDVFEMKENPKHCKCCINSFDHYLLRT